MLELLSNLTLIIATAITIILFYYRWRFQHWKKLGIPSANATIPFGALKNPLLDPESLGQLYERLYKEYKKKGSKHLGVFTYFMPVYMPIDLELVKNVLLKDFNYFVDRGFYSNEKDDPLSAHLFSLEGQRWKNLRAKLTPAFSTGKLKNMLPLIMEHALQLKEAVSEACLSEKDINATIVMGNYTADIIGSTSFGLDCNSFKNPNSEYRKLATRAFRYTKFEAMQFAIFINNHKLGRFLKYCVIPREVTAFFMKTMKDTVHYKESSNVKRHDFMDILIELKNSPDPQVKLSFNELAAQAFIFFVASIETSSTTFSLCMYELAMNEDIQEKLREEVNTIFNDCGGELTYESLSNIEYMQQVIDETLRKYPTATVLNRRCTEDYQIPGTKTILKKGTDVIIPVIGIHHDEEYYPNHQKFDPERFNEMNKAKLPPCSYLPFGEGPRTCIGLRFGYMQVKIGIATLLRYFKFSLKEGMPKTLKMDPHSFLLRPTEDILLHVEKLDSI